MTVRVTAARPAEPAQAPPFVLVHGAANSATVWRYWQEALAERGIASHAVNLRGHGPDGDIDLSETSMHDYADDVREAISTLDAKPVLMGWSMGGLVAMMVSASGDAVACVGLAPSTPVREADPGIEIRRGEFGPEEYGITTDDPKNQPFMPDLDIEERAVALASLDRESRRARDERKAGIVIASLPCPAFIVTGNAHRQWPRTAYDGLWLDADYEEIEGASHWGLVLSRRALKVAVPAVTNWLARQTD